jgi:PAS domain S-box-containing protein
MELYDLSAPKDASELYVEPAGWRPAEGYRLREWRRDLNVGNRTWRIEIVPSLDFVTHNSSWSPWLALTGGLLFTSLVSAFLLTISGRAAQVQVLVRQRTAELENLAASLRENEERFRLLVEQSVDGILVHGPDLRYVEANPAACRMLGYSRDEILDRSVVDMVEEDKMARIVPDEQRFASGESRPSEYRCRRKGRSVFIGEVTGSLLPDGRFLGILRDITERKRNEETMMHYVALVESSEDAIIGSDRNGVVTSWNRGAELMYGYSRVKAVGQPIIFLIPEAHIGDEQLILGKILDNRSVRHYETIRRRKDGTLIDLSITVSPLRNLQGQIVGASKIARDISERK